MRRATLAMLTEEHRGGEDDRRAGDQRECEPPRDHASGATGKAEASVLHDGVTSSPKIHDVSPAAPERSSTFSTRARGNARRVSVGLVSTMR